MSDAWGDPGRAGAIPTDAPVGVPAPFGPPPANGLTAAASEPVLVSIGDIACTQHWVVTPNATFPVAGTTWTVANQTTTTESIPAYAIVLAIVFFLFCLLGLLFLLIKERRTQGFVTVTVQGPSGYHATQVAVSHPAQAADTEARVHYIRSLAAASR